MARRASVPHSGVAATPPPPPAASRCAHAGSRFLQLASVAPRTREKYQACLAEFLTWAAFTSTPSVPPLTLTLPSDDLDALLSDYLHHLYFTCSSYSRASSTVYGLMLHDARLKDRLRLSCAALRGWRKITPSRSYPPLTWDAACAVAVQLVKMRQRSAAVAVLVSFDCYLRVSEMARLRRCDVVDASCARMGSSASATYRGVSLILTHTKTGPNQSVRVSRPVIADLLLSVCAAAPDTSKALVFGLSAAKFRRLFKAACAALGLSRDYVPHSLRHGGATADHCNGVPMDDIILRGRWASLRSARRYVQAGQAMLAARTDFPAKVAELGALVARPAMLRACMGGR